jgi:rhomboid protease GluP
LSQPRAPNVPLDPARSQRPARDPWKPWATYGLIAANVAMFGVELAGGAGLGGPSAEAMIALGANFGPLTCGGQPWRLVTAMFLHFGVIHIGMNMVCLYQVSIVERVLGRAEYLALYLSAGLVGGLASLAMHPVSVSAGASGAVFGMFGAFAAAMVARRKRVDPGAWKRTMRSLGMFFGINLVFGLSQRSIDLAAHVGGLAAGFAGGFVLVKTATPTSPPLLRALAVVAIGGAVALGGLHLLPH